MSDHQRRVCVVTGGAAGIGLAVVERFTADGDVVVALDRDAAALAELSQRADDAGWSVETIAVDVADPAAVERAATDIAQRHEAVDVLVCAAGIQRYGTVEETSPELFNEVVGVNLGGVFSVCHHVMPMLKSDGGGSVVVVSSIQAYASQTGVAAYSATKGALLALVRAMAVDHARDGVRVNAVCPGSVDTPMLRWAAGLFSDGRPVDDVVDEWGQTHPLGRVAQASEVADAVAYLASPQASFVTGADLKVDGGVTSALGVTLPNPDP
jgi:NAD(P)-dependent dehydrogenase (short-subunit alcohol dehydrogenase family)